MKPQPPKEKTIESRALKGGGALLVRHGTAFLFNFIGGALLARRLGPDLMGVYFTVFAWFLIARSIVDFGTSPRLIQKTEEPDGPWLSSVFRLQGLLTLLLVISALALALSPFPHWYLETQEGPFRVLLASAALALVPFTFQCVSTARLERRLDYVKVGLVELTEPVLFNAAAVGLVLCRPTAWSLAIALVLRGFIPALGSLLLSGTRPSWRREGPGPWGLVREVWPLVSGQAVLWWLNLVPSLILVPFAGPSAFALANMAYSLLGSMGFLVSILQRVSFAALSRIRDDSARTARIVGRLLDLVVFFCTPLYLGLAAFGPLWVQGVYGAKWQGMEGLLPWVALPMLLSAVGSVFYASALADSRNRLVFVQNLLNAVLFTGVLAALAKSHGAYAWPWAGLAAVPVAGLYVRAHVKRHGPVPYRRALFGLCLGVAWLFGTVRLLGEGRWTAAGLVAAVFSVVWIFGMGRGLRLQHLVRNAMEGRQDALSDLP